MILDCYISEGRFYEFIIEVWKIRDEEYLWDIWINKIEDKSFNEFRDSCKPPEPIDQNKIKNTVNESFEILNGFSLH